MQDPAILIDDVHQTPYIIYGDKKETMHVAGLNDDMISLHETPKPIKHRLNNGKMHRKVLG